MVKLKIILKYSVHPIEIETSSVAATRILNRHTLFMQNGKQASYKFPLDAPMAGFLSASFENVQSVMLQTD